MNCLLLKVWTCGGSLEIVPCSRVGHVFRSITPYTLPGGKEFVVYHNTRRLIDVWLDEWSGFYYAHTPNAKKAKRGDISYRIAWRKQKKCKVYLSLIIINYY